MNNEIEVSISCDECVRRHTPDCADCLVSFVLGGEPDELTMTRDDASLARLLTSEGLVPQLKFLSLSRRAPDRGLLAD